MLPFKVGGDPEFIIKGKDAQKEITRRLLNRYPKTLLGFKTGAGILGWDIQGVGEIRPTESKDPKIVVNRLALMFQELYGLEVLTKNFRPLGGHIHLGLPRMNIHWEANARAMLPWLLAPILNSEIEDPSLQRSKKGYGTGMDDFMWKPATQTYEIRFLNAEWLTTPELAEATLLMAGWAAFICWEHMRDVMEYASWTQRTPEGFWRKQKYQSILLNPKECRKIKENANFEVMAGWKIKVGVTA